MFFDDMLDLHHPNGRCSFLSIGSNTFRDDKPKETGRWAHRPGAFQRGLGERS